MQSGRCAVFTASAISHEVSEESGELEGGEVVMRVQTALNNAEADDGRAERGEGRGAEDENTRKSAECFHWVGGGGRRVCSFKRCRAHSMAAQREAF